MPGVIEKIDSDLLEAQKNKDELKRDILRLVKSAVKNAAIEKGSDLSEEEAITVLNREVKKRKESIAAYEQANRPELVASEQAEIDIIQAYLPELMDEATIKQAVQDYLAANPTTTADIGKAMGALSATLKGKADLGQVSKILRELVQ